MQILLDLHIVGNQQIVWPFTIGYFTDGRIHVAWEKKHEFRHFNTSKIILSELLSELYTSSRDKLFRQWQALQLAKIKK